MPIPPPERKYHFSDGRLIEVSEEKRAFALRDVADLTPFGIDTTWINAFQTPPMIFRVCRATKLNWANKSGPPMT